MNNRLQNILLGLIIVVGIVLCAALLAAGENKGQQNETTNKKTTAGTAQIINAPTNATDIQTKLAVVTLVNTESKTLGVRIYEDGENKTFRMEKGVFIYSAFDNSMALSQLDMGDVVYVTYDAVSDSISEVRLTNDINRHSKVSGVSVNTADKVISFYSKKYVYSRDVVVAANDRLITPEELNSNDILTVYEKDNKVVSIVVDRGHGYLTLTGIRPFIGGYVNVGGEVIKTIEENMIITVTEGQYKVQVSNGEYSSYKTTVIERDKVTVVDFSEFAQDVTINGNVLFDINVDGAKLYLNGAETDYTEGVLTLAAGKYSVRVAAEGYENYSDSIEVTDQYQKVQINLVPKETQETDIEDESSISSQEETSQRATESTSQYETETTTKVSQINKVYIDGPDNAIIYFDGSYLGMAPLSFDMVTGEHTFIVLTATDVKSYTVNLLEGADDVRYDFSVKD